LKELLYEEICEEFEKAHHRVNEKIPLYTRLLLRTEKLGSWAVPLFIQGQQSRNLRLIDLDLLERLGLLEGKIKFTHRNAYKNFRLTTKGKSLVKRIKEES
jgi:hypothetical protein